MELIKVSENIEQINHTVVSNLDRDIQELKKSAISSQYNKELTKRISK